jgi:hypothetical protein
MSCIGTTRALALVVLAAPVAAIGCGGPAGGDDILPDACVGGCEPTPDAFVPVWRFDDVYGVPNLDNDDGTTMDWNQGRFAGDNDFAPLVLPASALGLVEAGGDVELSLTSGAADVRVYLGMQHVLGGTAGSTYTFTPEGADVLFEVEFRSYAVTAQLQLASRAPGGVVRAQTSITLRAAPLILNHHLQAAEHVWAVRVNGNAAFISAFEDALGSSFTAVNGSSYGSDVWIQDEIEFATLTGQGDQRMDVVIDSIRNRGLDSFPERELVGPDVIAATWGGNLATTYDSFGNLEASPPVTVNGVAYPYGRIYYGYNGTVGINSQIRQFLASQKVQAPFALATNWLCVGHVDEVVTFVPDPASAKGFKMVIADVPTAWALLQSLPSNQSLGRYGNSHGYATIGAILSDTNLVTLNNAVQTDRIDPFRTTLMTELGLTEDDVIKIPGLFERVGGCNGRVAALIPGMVNLTIAKVGGTTHLLTADPFFRASGETQADDPLISAFRQAMPAGMELHFVDDWYVYHMSLGEVHCGSNVRRTPTVGWWESAMHLVGGN